jgi:hypothetical protein
LRAIDRRAMPSLMSDDMQRALRALGRLPPERPLPTDGTELVLSPREDGLAEKVVPVDQVIKKLIASRDKLRVLEQRVNASGLDQDGKLALQARITHVYDAFATLGAFFSDDALPPASDGEDDA